MLGFNNAVWLAEDSKGAEAIALTEKSVCLLESVMRITGKRTLNCSCSWLEGMVCEAKEDWMDKRHNPDEDEERFIRLEIRMGKLALCDVILPSRWYNMLCALSDCKALRDKPEFHSLVDRVKALIVTRTKSK